MLDPRARLSLSRRLSYPQLLYPIHRLSAHSSFPWCLDINNPRRCRLLCKFRAAPPICISGPLVDGHAEASCRGEIPGFRCPLAGARVRVYMFSRKAPEAASQQRAERRCQMGGVFCDTCRSVPASGAHSGLSTLMTVNIIACS